MYSISTGMFEDILLLIAARPFQAFTIHLPNGETVFVPTDEHISVLRHVRRIFVERVGSLTYCIIQPEMITRCTVEGQSGSAQGS